jgi:hypothetical protein
MTPTPEQIARAFAIADEAMFELLLSEGVLGEGGTDATEIGLADEYSLEVDELSKASPALREAFEWLQPRGYVELGQDEHGEYINVIRRPGEE